MPLRDMLRNPDKLKAFRKTGTIEGVSSVVIPTPGLPPRPRKLGFPDAGGLSLVDSVRSKIFRLQANCSRYSQQPPSNVANNHIHQ